jgi:hypothetical protein
MPVISSIDFNSLSGKFAEYSRCERVLAVIVGAISVYVLHSVCNPSSLFAKTNLLDLVCVCVEPH